MLKEDTGKVDYNKIEETALTEQPKLIICGETQAYSQDWDYKKFRENRQSRKPYY